MLCKNNLYVKNLTRFVTILNHLFNDAMTFVQAIYPAVVGLKNGKNVTTHAAIQSVGMSFSQGI
jgi:hypothetical protein